MFLYCFYEVILPFKILKSFCMAVFKVKRSLYSVDVSNSPLKKQAHSAGIGIEIGKCHFKIRVSKSFNLHNRCHCWYVQVSGSSGYSLICVVNLFFFLSSRSILTLWKSFLKVSIRNNCKTCKDMSFLI